jgi:hypothetical protein
MLILANMGFCRKSRCDRFYWRTQQRFERVTFAFGGQLWRKNLPVNLNIYFKEGLVKGNITAPLEPGSWITIASMR